MEQGRILPLPTRLNAEQAWEEYARLMREYNANPELRVSLDFCQRLTRAFSRWQCIFLAVEAA